VSHWAKQLGDNLFSFFFSLPSQPRIRGIAVFAGLEIAGLENGGLEFGELEIYLYNFIHHHNVVA